jgi:hypothetical protein
MRSRLNTANRINMANRFNMLSRFVDTQRIGCGVGSGVVYIPNRFTIHGPITIRTTGTMAGITAAVDIAAAVAVDTPGEFAVAVADTPAVVTVAIGNHSPLV